MGALVSVILAWFRGKTVLEIAITMIKWTAFVALVRFVLFVALGAAVTWATGYMLDFAMQGVHEVYANSGLAAPPGAIQLAGVAGYIADKMRLVEVFNILLTGWSFAFVRASVPFL